jgi:serine/threonine protein kinase
MSDEHVNSEDQTLLPSSENGALTSAPVSGIHVEPITEPTLSGLERLAKYDCQQKIASWRFGEVFEASHPKLDRRVWLVVLNSESLADDTIRKKFLERVQRLASVEHPNIQARIWEAIDEDDVVYVACEPPTGDSVTLNVQAKTFETTDSWFFDNSQTMSTISQGISGLCAMHQVGVHHGALTENSLYLEPRTNALSVSGWIATGFEPDGGPAIRQQSQPEESGQHQDLRDFSLICCKLLCDFTRVQASECDSPASMRKKLFKSRPHIGTATRLTLSKLAHPAQAKIDSVESARKLANNLVNVNARSAHLVSWAARLGTLLYEIASHFLVLPFVLVLTLSSKPQLEILALSAGLAFLPSLIFEVLFRVNPGRRVRGIRLLDRSGSAPRRLHLFLRWLLRVASILTLGSLAMLLVVAGFKVSGNKFPIELVWAGFPIGFILTYLTAFFLPHRRPIHDYYTGITLGKLVPKGAMESAATRFSGQDKTSTQAEPESGSQTDFRKPLSGKFDQYELLKLLGQGGMGSVYAAIDSTLNRKVAIKTIVEELVTGAEALTRFEREAKLGAQLGHENIAKVIGVGNHAGAPYLVMEYIDGEDLQDIVNQHGPVAPKQAWDYITQAAKGLQAVNDLGIVHRDIKPANLMLDKFGTVKVMDFGVSKRSADSDQAVKPGEHEEPPEPLFREELTQMGAMIGTLMYMSPEQAACKEVGTPSDIYSLGLTLWFPLAGKPPYEYREKFELIAKQISEYPSMTAGHLPALSEAQTKVLERMVCKNVEGRYQNYDTLLADLELTTPHIFETATLESRMIAVLVTSLSLVPLLFAGSIATEAIGAVYPLIFSAMVFAAVYIIGVWKFGQTPGKWAKRLKVVSLDEGQVSLWQSVVRYFGSVPIGIGSLVTAIAGFPILCHIAWAAIAAAIYFDRTGRAPHDYLAGTKVIKLPKPVDASLLSDEKPPAEISGR